MAIETSDEGRAVKSLGGFTIGNIITILLIIAQGVWSASQTNSQLKTMAVDVADIKQNQQKQQERLENVEISLAGFKGQMDAFSSRIDSIRNQQSSVTK